MSEELILVTGRLIERLIIVLFAGMSLWLGWKMFLRRSLQNDQVAEFSWKEFAVKFQKVAPGVFFAFFGAAILLTALVNNLSILPGDAQQSKGKVGISYMEQMRIPTQSLQALNLAVEMARIPAGAPIVPADRTSLSRKADDLEVLRNSIIQSQVGPEKFQIWSRLKPNPSRGTAEEKVIFEEIEKLMNDKGSL